MTYSMYVTLSINDTEQNNAQHSAVGYYAECHALLIERVIAFKMNVIMLSHGQTLAYRTSLGPSFQL
jgi:hypothetical protein